jgi:putative sterol carrier protein
MTAIDFLEKLPSKVQKDAIEGLETTFHFNLEGDGGGQITLALRNGELVTSSGLDGEADCVINSQASDFLKVVTGELNPMMAILTGKLKISNQGEMLKYAKIFGLM